jgi:hypothetical protein
MRRVEYICDICGDVVGKLRTGAGERPFTSFELGLMGNHCKAYDRFVSKTAEDSERHLCHCCLAGLVALARRTLPAGTFKDGMTID